MGDDTATCWARHLRFYADFDHRFDAVASAGDGRARIEVDAYPPRLTQGGGGRFGPGRHDEYL